MTVAFRVFVDEEAYVFLHSLDRKSQRIIRDHLDTLKEDPYPGSSGDKERLCIGKNRIIHRMHICAFVHGDLYY